MSTRHPQIKSTRHVAAAAAVVAALALGGCSGWEPIDVHENSEIPQGSGLVSGDRGGWTIFSVKERRKPSQQDQKEEAPSD